MWNGRQNKATTNPYMVNVLKFRTLFSFQIKSCSLGQKFAKCLWECQTGKTLTWLLLQKQSDLGLHCLSRPFRYATSVQNFRTFNDKCSKIPNTFLFLFSNKMMVICAGIHKLLVWLANREDPDQSDLVLSCCLGLFGRQLVFEILEHLP